MPFRRISRYAPLVLALLAGPLSAQSARPLSVQASYLRIVLRGESLGDVAAANGFEGQLRYTRGRWSLGGGMEYSRHGIDGQPTGYGLRRFGPFLEPRLLVPWSSNTLAAYVAGRLSVVQVTALVPDSVTTLSAGSATGTTINIGGGLLIRLSPRLNFDVGTSAGFSSFGSVTFPSGTTGGSLGTGTNVILRVGFGLGL